MQTFRTPLRIALALLLTLLIGACGGGGGGGGESGGTATPAGPDAGSPTGGAGSPTGGAGSPTGGAGGPSGGDGGEPSGGGGPPETPSWVSVDHDLDALPNTNYAATRDDAQVVITLPASLSEGEVVRVRGDGQGGWKIAQHDGQMITLSTMAGDTWTAHTVEGLQGILYVVDSSADGSHLVALEDLGQVHTSSDGGVTWQTRSVDTAGTPRTWWSVAISADGHHMAAAEFLGDIYISDDDGTTWSPQFSGAQRYWGMLAWGTAADGSRLLAASELGGPIHLRSQAGGWSAVPGDDTWMSVAFMANDSKVVAATSDGRIRIFDMGNQAWTTAGPAFTSCNDWCNVVGSTDGMLLSAFSANEPIYISDNGGPNWTPSTPARGWVGIAASSDGNRLLGADANYLYASSDHGKNWKQSGSHEGAWCDVAASADSTTLVAVDCGSQVYTSFSATTLSTGSISGGAGDSIDLKYIGNGVFQEVARTGKLTSQ